MLSRDGADVRLGLADDGLAVVAGHVVEPDPVVVEVVEDGKAVLVTVTVVGLRTVCSSSVGPQTSGSGTTRRPPDGGVASVVDVTASPEVPLVLPSNQTCELPLLGGRIKGDGAHALAAAEGGALAGGEAGATVPPAHKVVTPLESMVGSSGIAASAAAATSALGAPTAATAKEVGETAEKSLGGGRYNRQSRQQQQTCYFHFDIYVCDGWLGCFSDCGSTRLPFLDCRLVSWS